MRAFTSKRLVFATTLLAATSSCHPLEPRQFDGQFDWATVEASRILSYSDCYDYFKCARLEVPLDWTTANSSSELQSSDVATIAIVTLPATVPKTDPSFGGTILINPGGPGGSGTSMALTLGSYIQGVADGDRHYEILGFDPRGVGLSTPRANCYKDEFSRAADSARQEGMPSVLSGAQGLAYQFQSAKGFSELCEQGGPGSILNYMSTASVARDMLEIVERVDELRSKASISRARTERKKPGLQYLGMSYGTFLGNTFASMFPGRVDRMVLDGVVDAKDYTRGTWAKNLNDAEVVVDHFYKTCLEAEDLCELRQPGDGNLEDIRTRVDAFLATLAQSPVSVLYQGRVRLITSLLVRETFRALLYNPIKMYEPLSAMLARALHGDYTLLQLYSDNGLNQTTACEEPSETFPPTHQVRGNDQIAAIACGDSIMDSPARNASWVQQTASLLNTQSPTVGEAWSQIVMSCSGWSIRPKYTFRGPWGTSNVSRSDKPSAPLLILSNRYDHATPLANAEALSRDYPGSNVVVQESWGHSALLTSKSACTAKAVREYFDSGKVPREGLTCPEDCAASIPFKACPGLVDA